jgi:signal transduction histidine kinase/CheY-like chemotaxis protein
VFLRGILDGVADGVVAVADDGSIRFANRAAVALLGQAAHELVGTPFPLPLTAVSERALPGRPSTVVALRVAQASFGDEILHLVTMRDVTARRRLDRLRHEVLRADRRAAMVEVTRTIAHEIRNPAAFILANLAVMRDMCADFQGLFEEARISRTLLEKYRARNAVDELREMIEDNVLGIDRMRSFLEGFRAVTREPRRRLERVDLGEVAGTACDVCVPWLDARVEVVREIAPMPPLVGDRVGLILAVVTLLANAAEAMDGVDQPRLLVQTSADDQHVRVAVRDVGRGIPPEHLDRIFDPLFLPDPEEGALGVGLAVASDIASAHGGRIEVESTPGAGSRFLVVLPRVTGLALEERHAAAPGELRGRVLIIDDDPAAVASLRSTLEHENDVTEAHGGAQALDLLAEDHDFDVVLCALTMAVMDGPEVHAAMRERAPELAPRMVFIGDSSATPRIRRFVESERVLVLEKPVVPELLLDVVERVGR